MVNSPNFRQTAVLIVKRRSKLGIALEAVKIGQKNPEKRMTMIQRSKQLLSLLVCSMW